MTDRLTGPDVTEQLLQQTDDPAQPGVYVLALDNPGPTLHAHARRWWTEYQTVQPDDVGALAGTKDLLYVGAASNLRDRLEDHVRSDVRKSTWLSVYPPVGLRQVAPSPDTGRAFDAERQTAHRVAQATPESTTLVCNGVLVG
jgi:predicted GIY-YIG superfamily endonuclease